MVALVTPHRTHASILGYVSHLVAWWLVAALSSYGLLLFGAPGQLDWSPGRPRYWRAEARRGLRDCERILRAP
jgi:hypothetical protein